MVIKNQKLDTLLNPSSIAIVGASLKPKSYGLALLKMLTGGGFKGKILPINPKYINKNNTVFYSSLSELPVSPEHTVIAVASHRVENAVNEAIKANSKSLTILVDISQEKFLNKINPLAKEAGISICGPNSMGIHNLEDCVRISPFIFPLDLVPGGISLIVQSGSVLGALANNDRRLRYNLFISTGSEIVTSAADYLIWILNKPSTKVVGMFIESIRDPNQFIEALKIASKKNIPVVILKVGRTEASSKMALSHTGALVGNHEVFKAVLEKYGAHIVQTIDELAASLQVFNFYNSCSGKGIASIHDSGGERELIVDLADDISVPFASLLNKTKENLSAELEETMDVDNPLDAWGSGHDADKLFRNSFLHLIQDPNVSIGLYVMDWRQDYYLHLMHEEIIYSMIKNFNKPVIAVSNYSLTNDHEMAIRFLERGIPLIKGTHEALVAVKNLIQNSNNKIIENSFKPNKKLSFWKKKLSQKEPLTVLESFKILKDYNIQSADHKQANSLKTVMETAENIGFPVVLKTLSNKINHKTEQNAVYVNIKNKSELKFKYNDLKSRLGKNVLIAKMILNGSEWSLGVINDPAFGPAIMISAGGTLIDLLDDKVVMMAPFNEKQIKAKIKSLKSYKLLKGFRGSQKLSETKLCQAAAAFSHLAWDLKDFIIEADINPLTITRENALALDSLILKKEKN